MKGDFSRFTFDPNKGYTGVRMQQGRVQLDADWNEQVDIVLHQLRTRFQDLVGARPAPWNGGAGPFGQAGFQIRVQPHEPGGENGNRPLFPAVEVGPGRYYVDGILCENGRALPFTGQPDLPGAALPPVPDLDTDYIFYLDVWERHVTVADDPDLGEPALDGLDTTTRSRTVWQVKWLPCRPGATWQGESLPFEWHDHLAQAAGRPQLSARWQPHSMGLDNQLYRVEIHDVDDGRVTFKWSRENGSVVLPLVRLEPGGDGCLTAHVTGLRDLALLKQGDWVEVVDDAAVLNGRPGPLYQVAGHPEPARQITRVALTLPALPPGDAPWPTEAELRQGHALLRRWDHGGGAMAGPATTVAAPENNGSLPSQAAPDPGALVEIRCDTWLALERGIEVCFEPGGQYRCGDYWLIPARARGDRPLLWPQDETGRPLPRPPHGIDHHFSPLALSSCRDDEWRVHDLRLEFDTLTRVAAWEEEVRDHLAHVDRQIEDLRARVEQEMMRTLEMADRAGLLQRYESLEDLSPGDVVSLEPATGRIVAANQHNASLVVGVVVAIQESDGARQCQVAQYGRVACKVAGPVEPGDVLVPGEINGAATRAGLYIQPGTLVGKALAAHQAQDCPATIEAMVTLR